MSARVGSSNLNVASWLGNVEIDVAIDDEPFAGRMQAQFERDLGGATALAVVAALGLWWPRALAWPFALLAAWSAVGLLGRYLTLAREAKAARSSGR